MRLVWDWTHFLALQINLPIRKIELPRSIAQHNIGATNEYHEYHESMRGLGVLWHVS